MKRIVGILLGIMIIFTIVSFFTVAEDNPDESYIIEFKQLENIQELKVDAIYEENMLLQNFVGLNNPPHIPSQPSGPITVILNQPYYYNTVATDPDDDYISYGWDGGNGVVDDWTLYFPSGFICTVSITFYYIGTFNLQVKARDLYGLESNFSEPLIVTVSGSTTNNPPYISSNPHPSFGETDVDVNSDLSWTGGDPDSGDSVSYDVYFGSILPLSKVASNISNSNYNPGLLLDGLTYFWSVVTWDNHGLSTQGPMWYFTTLVISNIPPLKPIINGPENCIIGISYTFYAKSADLNSDQLYYLFDWDDGNNSGWIGPYNSEDICEKSHIWNIKGSYSVKVKVKDVNGAESVWSDSLPIKIPKIYNCNTFFQRFLIMLNCFSFSF